MQDFSLRFTQPSAEECYYYLRDGSRNLLGTAIDIQIQKSDYVAALLHCSLAYQNWCKSASNCRSSFGNLFVFRLSLGL